MASGLERRTCRRFTVPDATVDWRELECPLRDLSRGGVRFLCEAPPPQAGTRVELRIHVPGETGAIEVRGQVAWSLPSSGRIYHLAVEFAPYGAAPGANPPAILERLVGLEARFLAPDASGGGEPAR